MSEIKDTGIEVPKVDEVRITPEVAEQLKLVEPTAEEKAPVSFQEVVELGESVLETAEPAQKEVTEPIKGYVLSEAQSAYVELIELGLEQIGTWLAKGLLSIVTTGMKSYSWLAAKAIEMYLKLKQG